jgi:hypothetical protein
VITGAVLCPSPPLLHPALTGREAVLPELRAACAQAVSWLLRDDPGEIVVVGPAATTGEWDAAGRLDPAAFAPAPGRGGRGLDPAAYAGGGARLDPAAYAGGGARLDPAAYGGGGARLDPAAYGGEVEGGARVQEEAGAEGGTAAESRAGAEGGAGADRHRSLPLALGLGVMLLDQAGYDGRRRLLAAGQDEPASACAGLGASLSSASAAAVSAPASSSAVPASSSAVPAPSSAVPAPSAASTLPASGRTALLVMGDGSARRSLKAPGYLDPRAAAFDAEVERAVRTGDLGALLRLDQALARDLMATGRPAWQVLAGAMQSLTPVTEVLYCGDPFGVAYLVACLRPRGARSLPRIAAAPERTADQLVRCGSCASNRAEHARGLWPVLPEAPATSRAPPAPPAPPDWLRSAPAPTRKRHRWPIVVVRATSLGHRCCFNPSLGPDSSAPLGCV